MRYYVADYNGIPYREQPENGYTKLQVIERVQREVESCVRLYGGKFGDYVDWFQIKDKNMKTVTEFRNAI